MTDQAYLDAHGDMCAVTHILIRYDWVNAIGLGKDENDNWIIRVGVVKMPKVIPFTVSGMTRIVYYEQGEIYAHEVEEVDETPISEAKASLGKWLAQDVKVRPKRMGFIRRGR